MRGMTIAILACMCFGIGPIFEKTLMNTFTPLALSALRSLTAGVLLVLMMRVYHKLKEIQELSKRDALLLGLIAGMVGIMGPFFFLTGLSKTSVANALLIGRSNSLLIAFFAALLLDEKFTFHQILGTILMVSGLLVIFSRGFVAGYEFRDGDLYIAVAAFMWALSAVLMKKYICHLPPEVIVAARNLLGGVVLTYFAFHDITYATLTYMVPLYLAGGAIFGVLLAQFLWYEALEHTDASNVGFASISIPIFGTIFASVFLGETLVSYQIVGGALVLLGLFAMEIHLSTTRIHKLECVIKAHLHFNH